MKVTGGEYVNTSARDMFTKEKGKYEQKARQHIENGDPMFSMGLTSMTEQDWENLMDNIDDYMKKAREIRDKELEKNVEESMERRIYNKVYFALHKSEEI